MKYKLSLLLLVGVLTLSHIGFAQTNLDFFGKAQNVPLNNKEKAPAVKMGDPFGAELYQDGRTDVALDANSIAAQNYAQQKGIPYPGNDISVRKDITSGEPVSVYIAPEHYVQLTFLKDNEIVFPVRAYAAQPKLLNIKTDEKSPFVYVSATTMLEGQSTNLFVETQEDGTIQTYVVNLIVTEPKNIRPQVAINLVNDRTPSIRKEGTSQGQSATPAGTTYNSPSGNAGTGDNSSNIPTSVHAKFTTEDVKNYFNTMIEMASRYGEAKEIEANGGKIIYRNSDISAHSGGAVSYIDPVDGCQWAVQQVWFFPRYDAILLDTICNNRSSNVSSWDYAQLKWKALDKKNPQPKQVEPVNTTAAAPSAIQTLPYNTNQIFILIQGERIDPDAEFAPVFPRAERRGNRANYPQNFEK
jgi:hypothetical protein